MFSTKLKVIMVLLIAAAIAIGADSVACWEKNAEATAKIAAAYAKAGQGSEVDLLQAKAFVLEVRLELLRNEQKAKSSK